MNFKDFLVALAMLLPTVLLICAAIITLCLPAKASAPDVAASAVPGPIPSYATTLCDERAAGELHQPVCFGGAVIE